MTRSIRSLTKRIGSYAMAKKALPQLDLLCKVLDYDPETGSLFWRAKVAKKIRIGDLAGRITNKGYCQIQLIGNCYLAHRIAWKMHTGADPIDQIDHINGCKSDNRIANLREATQSENLYNQQLYRSNTSGHKGVSWHKRIMQWYSYINVNGERKNLGYFPDLNDAVAAYAAAATVLHGEFLNLGTKGNNNV